MNTILKNHKADIKTNYGDRYFLFLLTPIRLRINIIGEKAFVNKDSSPLRELEKTEQDAIEVLENLRHDLKCDEKVSSLYISCIYTFAIFSSLSKNIENAHSLLTRAEDYHDMARQVVLDHQQAMLRCAAENLAIAYSDISETLIIDPKLSIQFLQKALDIQKKYNLDVTITEHNIRQEQDNIKLINTPILCKFTVLKNPNASFEIEINIKGLDRDNFKIYCKKRYKLQDADFTFNEDDTCSISFEKESIKRLNEIKSSLDSKDSYECKELPVQDAIPDTTQEFVGYESESSGEGSQLFE